MTKRDDRLESKMANVHYRIGPRKFRYIHVGFDYRILKYLFQDSCYIVGKGKSLDSLNKRHIVDRQAPVLGINEAIYKLETLELENPLFLIQQDNKLKLKYHGSCIISHQTCKLYDGSNFTYIPQRWGLSSASLTVSCAIYLAKELGVRRIYLCCFDGSTTRDTTYAKCIGYSEGDGKRFLKHREIIENNLGGTDVEWITPS